MANPTARTSQNTRREAFFQQSPFYIEHASTESLVVKNSDTGVNVFQVDASTGAVTATGILSLATLTLTAAASRIIPGATSFAVRDNANTLDHFSITNAGIFALIPETGAAQAAGAVVIGAAANTYTNGAGDVTSLLRLNGKFAGTALDNTSAVRGFTTEVHWSDSSNGASTFAGMYAFAYHDGATTDVQDLIGVIGRAYVTNTGLVSVGMWGVRGDLNFITATTTATVITSAAAVVAHQGSWSTPVTITTYAAFEAKTHTLNSGGAVVTDGYGVLVGMPSLAVGHNIGVSIGTRPATSSYTTGLAVWNNGAILKGLGATGVPADTSNNGTAIVIGAGNNSAANDVLCALYFYRSSTSLGFIGYDADSTTVMAGHTKALTDFVLRTGKCVVDVNGQIFSLNRIAADNMQIIQTLKTSGTVSTAFLFTGAAHTGLTPSSFAEFNFNAARTIAFDNTGGTIATAYTFQFQKPTYTAAAALAITTMATVRITGAPAVSSAAGATPTFTNSYAFTVDSGLTNLQALTINGSITNLDSGTVTGAALAATLSKTVGVVTTESMTTAGLATFTYTITNTKVAAVDVVLVNCSSTGAGIPVVSSVIPGAGSFTVVVYNAHATNAFNAAVKIYFKVIKTA